MSDTISEELSSLPEYFQYVKPVIEVQKEIGGSSKPGELAELVLDKLRKTNKSFVHSANRFSSIDSNDFQKIRHVLIHAGLLQAPQKGVWKLTEKALETDPSDINLHHLNELRKKTDREYRENRKHKVNGEALRSETAASSKKATCGHEDNRKRQLEHLKTLSSADLKKICQEVLRKSGFERVSIIGQSSEDCFEGECIFQENALMRSYVMLQFKCVQGLIGAEEIRDFRSAMLRRADKGIFMTVCSFTERAKLEAKRDGVSPVILIDGNNLVGMIEKFKIRLKAA